MALYAIGDIQGCFDQLKALLEKVNFDRTRDRLWFTGDLVNRGPKSLETLRYIKGIGDSAVTVLGNHDLHLLAVSRGESKLRKKDTFKDILDAPDANELLDWLRYRPLLYYEDKLCLVHAGLPPQWDLTLAIRCAKEVEKILRGPTVDEFFHHMYGDTPNSWSETLTGWERIRYITNCLTRIRYCDLKGNIDLTFKGPPGTQPDGFLPWFKQPDRKSQSLEIIFGHWSTLGFHTEKGIYGLDTGCLWGGQLTALRLDRELYRTSLECPCTLMPDVRKPSR